MKKLKIVLILLTLMFQFSFVHASTVVIGPTENVGAFWIDPNIPNRNTPASYQKWGQVFTAADNYLDTISFYLRSGSHDNDATYFKIDIRE